MTTPLETLDPFTPVWRTYGSRGSLRDSVFHLTPACPGFTTLRARMGKGRLGAQLAAGRRLCSYEAKAMGVA